MKHIWILIFKVCRKPIEGVGSVGYRGQAIANYSPPSWLLHGVMFSYLVASLLTALQRRRRLGQPQSAARRRWATRASEKPRRSHGLRKSCLVQDAHNHTVGRRHVCFVGYLDSGAIFNYKQPVSASLQRQGRITNLASANRPQSREDARRQVC